MKTKTVKFISLSELMKDFPVELEHLEENITTVSFGDTDNQHTLVLPAVITEILEESDSNTEEITALINKLPKNTFIDLET